MTGLNIAFWKLNIIERRVVGYMTGSQHVGGPFCAERVPMKPLVCLLEEYSMFDYQSSLFKH